MNVHLIKGSIYQFLTCFWGAFNRPTCYYVVVIRAISVIRDGNTGTQCSRKYVIENYSKKKFTVFVTVAGEMGSPGSVGSRGSQGSRGDTGQKGDQGISGQTGATGILTLSTSI